jgi:hypothetical protein
MPDWAGAKVAIAVKSVYNFEEDFETLIES